MTLPLPRTDFRSLRIRRRIGWGRLAYSGTVSGLMYNGLRKRLLEGRYGEGSIGDVTWAACNGLTSTKPACCSFPAHVMRSARSVRSPNPQDRFDVTL
jgi:hypothetical protein